MDLIQTSRISANSEMVVREKSRRNFKFNGLEGNLVCDIKKEAAKKW